MKNDRYVNTIDRLRKEIDSLSYIENNRQVNKTAKIQVDLGIARPCCSKRGDNIGNNTPQSILKIVQGQTQNTNKEESE